MFDLNAIVQIRVGLAEKVSPRVPLARDRKVVHSFRPRVKGLRTLREVWDICPGRGNPAKGITPSRNCQPTRPSTSVGTDSLRRVDDIRKCQLCPKVSEPVVK